ncbi:GNAT family N-acetyltransferase [Limobrevibacterium gyesilva]|uniref:GNAT family N-acetyltransferase n=1 Tax=Limobrevibacterium gyesilva TaxID=2991712 RepID=A0AA41YRZ4_9PROT|nr:GNAT family N-acetyltransferase [Limobrevibacterium gyesilva]MCW3475435.1 GNAT family N-acetyltransferase [Limobrevibacterium gyesilva]
MIAARPARPDDLPGIQALLRQLGYETRPDDLAERLRHLAATGTDPILVATDGSRCVGVLALHIARMLQLDRPAARITTLVVASDSRGRSVGRHLVEAATALAARAGCGRLELTTGLARTGAHAFYRALGFTQTALHFSRRLDDRPMP